MDKTTWNPKDLCKGQWKPTGVSFSAGGARVLGHFGVLSHLLSCGSLDHVRDWYGCSGGVFCALVGALGCTALWIQDLITHLDLAAFGNIEEDTVLNFLDQFGVSSGDKGIQLMKRFIDTWEQGISTWTFADLAMKRPGITFTVIATNLTEGALKVFNATNTPDTLLFDAMRASSAVPLYYTPWKDKNGDLLCDGAILEVYPWSSVIDKAYTLVVVCSDKEISGRPDKKRNIATVADYMSCLMNIMSKSRAIDPPKHWIAVNNSDIGFLDFQITTTERQTLFAEGVAAAKGWETFRKKVLSSETRGIHSLCVGHRTSPSCSPSQNRTLGSHQSCSLPLQPYPSQGLRNEELPRARRWSL